MHTSFDLYINYFVGSEIEFVDRISYIDWKIYVAGVIH